MPYSRLIVFTVALLMTHQGYACTPRDGQTTPTLLMPTRHKDENLAYAYTLQLAALALAKTEQDFGPCTLKPLKTNRPINRILLKIRDGQTFDIVDSTVSPRRDAALHPIPFPVYRGLMGYRIMMIRSGEQQRFDKVRSLEGLKQFTIGAAPHWKDREIIARAGFTTFPGDGLRALYRMLPAGRFDVLLRGAHEVIIDRMRLGITPGTTIENRFVVAFPLPVNFYIKKNNERLAKRLAVGLQRAIDDGEANALFFNTQLIKETLETLELNKRHFFYLCNHTLTRDFRLNDDRLWYKPWPKSIKECQKAFVKPAS